MIPDLVLAGLLLGRWWRSAILVGAAYWVWRLGSHPNLGASGPGDLVSIAFVGAANVAGGAAINRACAALFRKLPSEGRWTDPP